MEWNGTEQESSRWDFSTCFQLFPSLGVQLIKTTRQEYSSEPKNISQLSIIIHFQRIFAAFPRPISLLAPSLPRFFPGFFPGFFARPFFYCYQFFFFINTTFSIYLYKKSDRWWFGSDGWLRSAGKSRELTRTENVNATVLMSLYLFLVSITRGILLRRCGRTRS